MSILDQFHNKREAQQELLQTWANALQALQTLNDQAAQLATVTTENGVFGSQVASDINLMVEQMRGLQSSISQLVAQQQVHESQQATVAEV